MSEYPGYLQSSGKDNNSRVEGGTVFFHVIFRFSAFGENEAKSSAVFCSPPGSVLCKPVLMPLC